MEIMNGHKKIWDHARASKGALIGLMFTLICHTSNAAQSIAVQGRLLNADGSAVTSSAVQFTIKVKSPGVEDCLLYQETQTLNLSQTAGAFALTLGSGTRVASTVDGGNPLNTVFSNSAPISLTSAPSACANSATSFTPGTADTRNLEITFNDGSGVDSIPTVPLAWTPQSIYSQDAGKLAGVNGTQYLKVASGTTPATLSAVDYSNLAALLNGSSTQYMSSSSTAGTVVPNLGSAPSTPSAGQMWFDSVSSTMKYYNGTATQTIGTSTGLSSVGLTMPAIFSVSGSPLTSNGSITTTLANQSANTVFAGPSSGGAAAPTFRAIAAADLPTGVAGGIIKDGGNSLGAAMILGTNDANTLGLKTNNSTRMTIDSSGNVGIGTSSPNDRLDVSGGALSIREKGTSNGVTTSYDSEYLYLRGNSWSGAAVVNQDMRIYNDAHPAGQALRLEDTTGSGIAIFPGGELVLSKNVRALRSASTTQPLKLSGQINGNDSEAVQLGGANNIALSVLDLGVLTNNYITVKGATTGNAPVIGTKGDGNTNLAIMPSGTGNVGIGTTTPSNKLEVLGNTLVIGDSTVTGRIDIKNSGLTDNGRIVYSGATSFKIEAGSVNGTSDLSLMTGYTDRVTVKSTGNVGIGTTSPAARLDVADTGTTTSAILVPRAGNFTGTTANGMVRYNTTSNLFEFFQNGAWVNYTTVSDGRLKTNVEPVTHGLDIVNQLNPVFYDWDKNNPRTQSFRDKHEVGFIAQEVEKVLPEVVDQGEDSYRSVQYGKIVSVVVAAVKELYNKFLGHDEQLATQARQIASKVDQEALNAVKAESDAKIKSLESENAKLKQQNDAIKAYLCSQNPAAPICK